jgi:DnaK suppressor protein
MTRTEQNTFLKTLTAQHAELARAMGRRDGIAIEQTADAFDQIRFAADRELTTRSLERQSAILREVRAALDRIADGSYGTCLECEEDIGIKRLNAMPWATLCIACQEGEDRDTTRRFVSEPDFLKKAA